MAWSGANKSHQPQVIHEVTST